MKKKYNTPHRCHVVKTRMTEEEYADFTERLKHYDMSQAEFIRQAITRATIRPIVTVSPVNDELLSAVGRLTAEYGKIGGNLNQIARALNEYGTPWRTPCPFALRASSIRPLVRCGCGLPKAAGESILRSSLSSNRYQAHGQ